MCSEGSSMGHMCCGELGVGWAVFEVEWYLLQGDTRLTPTEKEHFGDSGGTGFADLCDRDYGEHAVLVKMSGKAGEKIIATVTSQLAGMANSP